jgi:hypothetical protein
VSEVEIEYKMMNMLKWKEWKLKEWKNVLVDSVISLQKKLEIATNG